MSTRKHIKSTIRAVGRYETAKLLHQIKGRISPADILIQLAKERDDEDLARHVDNIETRQLSEWIDENITSPVQRAAIIVHGGMPKHLGEGALTALEDESATGFVNICREAEKKHGARRLRNEFERVVTFIEEGFYA